MEILPHLHLWVSNVIPYPNRNNLLGKQVGGLKVIFDCGVDRNGKNIVWLCSCQCGNLSLQRGGDLSLGRVKSCGCGKRHLPKGAVIKNRCLVHSCVSDPANCVGTFSFILQCCLAVAENQEDEKIGVETKKAIDLIQALIRKDKGESPDTVGRVRDTGMNQASIFDYRSFW